MKRKIVLYLILCLFLLANSSKNNVVLGNYITAKKQPNTLKNAPPQANIVTAFAAGVAVVAGTVAAVYATGTLLGRVAYDLFGEESIYELNNPMQTYNSMDFSGFDPQTN